MDKQTLLKRIERCEEICKLAQNDTEGIYFDPYATLTNTETLAQKMYSASVEFLYSIKKAYDTYTEKTTFNVSLF